MSPPQFAAMDALFNSGFRPQVWGSDSAGWRVGPRRIPTRTKKSLERRGWITAESSRFADGETVDRLVATSEGRRAFIAAGGNPGSAGVKKRQRRFHRS